MTKAETYAKKYGITLAEAEEMVAYDEQTDRMTQKQINAEMTPEQKAAAKKARITTSGAKKERKVERKVDEVKKKLLNGFRIYLEGSGAKVEPLTTEAEMHFTLAGESYTVKLIKHRKKEGA